MRKCEDNGLRRERKSCIELVHENALWFGCCLAGWPGAGSAIRLKTRDSDQELKK